MALRRIVLRDFVIVPALDLDIASRGFTVLTGETGAGKSILIDGLQLALGSRADAAAIREGATRLEVGAEFDIDAGLASWLDAAGFDAGGEALLLRRTVDLQGRSRGWINGSPATATQLRELGDRLLDIHGQHAWQSLTRPEAVRALLDGYAGGTPEALAQPWQTWRAAAQALTAARASQESLQRERERLQWQIGELDKLAPASDEWETLSSAHNRASNAQALIDAASRTADALSDEERGALAALARATAALQDAQQIEPEFAALTELLEASAAQAADAVHTLQAYLRRTDIDPERLVELDQRMGLWISLARRYKRPPEQLATLLLQWRGDLLALDAAGDLAALERAEAAARERYMAEATNLGKQRRKAAPRLAPRGERRHAATGHERRSTGSRVQGAAGAGAKRSGGSRLSCQRPRRNDAPTDCQGGLRR